jgi:DNA-binding NarL/FixJ family response regulator
MRAVIAEDLVLLRDAIVRLPRKGDIEVVAAVGDGDALVEAAEGHRPDVAVVDVRLPPTQHDEGLRAALEARRRVPGIPILILSQAVEESYATELLADGAGAVGYLLKDRIAEVREFLAAVERVAAGGTAFDPEVVVQLIVKSRSHPVAQLTPREREVLAVMAEGRSNAAIAGVLGVGDGAVEKHVSSIFGKLGLVPSDNDHRRVLAVLAYLGR